MVSRTSFLSRQCDLIAFFCRIYSAHRFILSLKFSVFLSEYLRICFSKLIYIFLVVCSTIYLLVSNVESVCGHMMPGFNLHSVCAHCHDKKKGKDPCVEKPDSDCQHCIDT